VQVFPPPVRAACLACGDQCRESNHGGSLPSMESAAETLRQVSDIDGLTRRPSIFRARDPRCGFRSCKTAAAIYEVHLNVADRRNQHGSASLSRWCRSGSMATTR
jgi:hypothetical protein